MRGWRATLKLAIILKSFQESPIAEQSDFFSASNLKTKDNDEWENKYV